MLPTLKNNAAAGYQGPVKIELFEMCRSSVWLSCMINKIRIIIF